MGQGLVGRQQAAWGDSRRGSAHKEEESVRSSMQQSSCRQDQWARGADEDYVAGGQGLVGSYRGEGGGISGHPSDSQSHSGYKERESAWSSWQQSSSRQDPRDRGTDEDYMVGGQGGYGGEVGGRISGHPSDSQSHSGYKEKESAQPAGQQSSSRPDPRVRGADEDVVGGQVMFGGLSRVPYTERDLRASNALTEMMDTTAHSSRSPPNQTTSIPQRKENSLLYNTWGSGWDRDSHPSQVQGSLDSQHSENTWGAESSCPGIWDPRSNLSFDTAASQTWGGQPTGPFPGRSVNPPHHVFYFFHLCIKTSNHNA